MLMVVDHPDKEQYRQYEQQWKQYEVQMETQKNELMKRRQDIIFQYKVNTLKLPILLANAHLGTLGSG